MSETVLDQIIAKAIADAREEAVKQTVGQIELLGGDHAIREWIRGEVLRLLNADEQIKERIRTVVLRELEKPSARRY